MSQLWSKEHSMWWKATEDKKPSCQNCFKRKRMSFQSRHFNGVNWFKTLKSHQMCIEVNNLYMHCRNVECYCRIWCASTNSKWNVLDCHSLLSARLTDAKALDVTIVLLCSLCLLYLSFEMKDFFSICLNICITRFWHMYESVLIVLFMLVVSLLPCDYRRILE